MHTVHPTAAAPCPRRRTSSLGIAQPRNDTFCPAGQNCCTLRLRQQAQSRPHLGEAQPAVSRHANPLSLCALLSRCLISRFEALNPLPASMSSQHRLLATVWDQFQGRQNVANLVREILGQHAVDASLHQHDSWNIEHSVRTIGWIKLVFDSQRCHLSGIATGVADCPPYVLSCLLPPELLFSTILYLIDIKTKHFSSQTTLMTREFTRPRHVLAQAVLSGLRLLLLRKDVLTSDDTRRLQNAINSAWRDDRLHGVERFVVTELFAEILNSLNEPSRENPYIREWKNAKLPTYAAGLVCESALRAQRLDVFADSYCRVLPRHVI